MKTALFFNTFSFLKHGAGERYCMRQRGMGTSSPFFPPAPEFFSW